MLESLVLAGIMLSLIVAFPDLAMTVWGAFANAPKIVWGSFQQFLWTLFALVAGLTFFAVMGLVAIFAGFFWFGIAIRTFIGDRLSAMQRARNARKADAEFMAWLDGDCFR